MLSSVISLGIPSATEDVLLPAGRIEAGERPRSRKAVRSARKGSVASVPKTLSSASSATTKMTLLGANATKSLTSIKNGRKNETVTKGGKKKKRNKNDKKQASNNSRKGSHSTSAPTASPSNTKKKESSSAKSRQKKATPRLGSSDNSCYRISSAQASFCPASACEDTHAVTASVEAPSNGTRQAARLDHASARLPPLPAKMATNSNANISQIRA